MKPTTMTGSHIQAILTLYVILSINISIAMVNNSTKICSRKSIFFDQNKRLQTTIIVFDK